MKTNAGALVELQHLMIYGDVYYGDLVDNFHELMLCAKQLKSLVVWNCDDQPNIFKIFNQHNISPYLTAFKCMSSDLHIAINIDAISDKIVADIDDPNALNNDLSFKGYPNLKEFCFRGSRRIYHL